MYLNIFIQEKKRDKLLFSIRLFQFERIEY